MCPELYNGPYGNVCGNQSMFYSSKVFLVPENGDKKVTKDNLNFSNLNISEHHFKTQFILTQLERI